MDKEIKNVVYIDYFPSAYPTLDIASPPGPWEESSQGRPLGKLYYFILCVCVYGGAACMSQHSHRSENNFSGDSILLPWWVPGMNSGHQPWQPCAFTYAVLSLALLTDASLLRQASCCLLLSLIS